MQYRQSKKIIVVFISIFLGLFAVAGDAHGGGAYIGTGTGGAGGYSGTVGGTVGCNHNAMVFRVDCSGVSWLYYAAQSGYSAASAPFPHGGGHGRAYSAIEDDPWYVPSVCYQNGTGGFWHYGINLVNGGVGEFDAGEGGYGYGTIIEYLSSSTNSRTGHWSTSAWGYATQAPYLTGSDFLNNPTISEGYKNSGWQVVWSGLGPSGNPLYKAHHYGDPTSTSTTSNAAVIAAYNAAAKWDARQKGQAEPANVTSLPGGLFAFCYWDGMKIPPTTHYSAESKVYDGSTEKSNNSSVTIHSGSRSISFDHTIKRANDGVNGADSERYYVDAGNSTGLGSSSSIQSRNFSKNEGPVSVHNPTNSVPVLPGQGLVVWQKLYYEADSDATSLSNISGITCTLRDASVTANISGSVCIKLNRPNATFEGHLYPYIGSTEKTADTNVTEKIAANTVSISFKDKLKRTDGCTDGAGGTVASSWSAVDATNSTKPSSGGDSDALSRDCSNTSYEDVKTYTYNDVAVAPGGSITRCSWFTYESVITYPTSNNTDVNRNACITITRDPANRFTGTVTPKYDSTTTTANSTTNNNQVWDTSHTISFVDNIKRGNDTAGGTVANSWSTKIANSNITNSTAVDATGTTSPLAVNGSENLTINNVTTYNFNVNVNPGQTVKRCNRLTYQSTVSAAGNVNANADACQQIWRKKATFQGSITLKVGPDDSHLTATSGNSDTYDTTSSNGHVVIKVIDTITRNSDDSGGTVGSQWVSTIEDHMGTRTGSRTPASGTNTVNLTEGQSSNVKSYDNFSYDLLYGESITVCGTLSYQSEINNGASTVDHRRKCVTITRGTGATKCTGVELGATNSINGGRIIALNSTSGQSAISESTTTLFSTNNGKATDISIWARPGDLVHFEFVGCAAAQYKQYAANQRYGVPIQNVNYNITGESDSKNHGTVAITGNDSVYNFGNDISYNNVSASTFVGGIQVEKGRVTGNDPIWSNPSSNRGSDYACAIPGAAAATGGFYQIVGRQTAIGNESICKTGTLDAGATLSNKLSFKGLKVTGVRKKGSSTIIENITIDGHQSGETVYSDQYELVYQDLGTISAKANIKVPYNYKLLPYVSKSGGNTADDPDMGVVYSGTTINFNAGIAVAARQNSAFDGEDGYNNFATITKPTTVQSRYYIEGNGYSKTGSWTTIINKKRFNSEGSLSGMYDKTKNYTDGGANISSTVPAVNIPRNVPIGAKVCVQIRAYPADSHDSYSTLTVNGAGSGNIALSEDGSSDTLHTTVTACYTVAKKPSFSVEGSNTYSGGEHGFVTSVTNRTDFDASPNVTYKYGSWSEYGVYGNVATTDLRGMASGATYAYNTGNSGQSSQNLERSTTSHVSTTTNTRICTISTQTYTNDKCANGEIGRQGMGKNAAIQYRDRIKSRFTSGNAQPISESDIWASRSGGTCPTNVSDPHSENSKPTCFTAGGTNYVYMSKFNSGARMANRDANGTSHVVVNKNIPVYMGSGNSTLMNYFLDQNLTNSDERNFTYVYQVGTLVIDGNMFMGDYNGGNNSDKDPVLYNPNQMRQNIIVADRVLITGRVTNIDATIIADEVDTCAYASYDDFKAGKRVAVNANSNQRQLDSDKCNEELVINAPVIAKKIVMHRTYGGGYNGNTYSSSDDVKRGEIYYLRPDLFLWSYSQMQRYSQAVTVNSRELPTRY